MNLEDEEKKVRAIEARLQFLNESLTEEVAALKEVTLHLKHARDAQEILQLVSRAVQQKAHEKISEVVTKCLCAVFGEDTYEFDIVFEMKRGKTEAQLRFLKGDSSVDPCSASGGGVVDVAAFALRIACLVLHRPRLSQVLVMDEPFKFVSSQYQDSVRTMLEDLASEMKIQIIMVTHNPALATGKIIDLE